MNKGICIVLLTIAFGFNVPNVAKAQAGAPEAVLPEPQYPFGTAIEGEIVRHDFILFNRGSADLRIEKIKTG